MSNLKKTAFVLFSLSFTAAASAQDNGNASEIAAINERVAVMSAKLAELEMRAKIAAKQAEIEKSGSKPVVDDSGFTPSIKEIGGIDGKIWAVLNTLDGVQTVRVGDVVDKWVVSDIQMDSVTVTRKNKTVRLSFAPTATGTNLATVPSPGSIPGGMAAPAPSPVPFSAQ